MVLTRTVKSRGSDAPIVGVKPVIRSAGDGVKKRAHRGEREVSRKTIARGMPGRSGVTVVTNSYACFILHARPRVHCAPGIPCALYSQRGETILQTSGASRREIAESCFGNWGNVIARSESDEAIHSYFAATWIASRSLSSGARSRDPLAPRNDDGTKSRDTPPDHCRSPGRPDRASHARRLCASVRCSSSRKN